MTIKDFENLFMFYNGGLGMFLFGVHKHVRRRAEMCRRADAKSCWESDKQPFVGVLVGALITAVIQRERERPPS